MTATRTISAGVVLILVGMLLLGALRPAGIGEGPAKPSGDGRDSMVSRLHPDAQVAGMIHRACYNCHSDQPALPWYAGIWPASALIRYDRERAQARLNFSEWDRLSSEMSRIRLLDACGMISAGRMPLWYYRPLHPEARLSPEEVRHFCAWARAGR
jgi:hypothetical protein